MQACSGKVTSTWGKNRDKKVQCRKETNYKMKAGCGEEEGRKKGQEKRRGGRGRRVGRKRRRRMGRKQRKGGGTEKEERTRWEGKTRWRDLEKDGKTL